MPPKKKKDDNDDLGAMRAARFGRVKSTLGPKCGWRSKHVDTTIFCGIRSIRSGYAPRTDTQLTLLLLLVVLSVDFATTTPTE